MAKNKKSKSAVGSQNKRPNIGSTSVLSDTSLELQNLGDEDNDDDETQPSTSARRRPTPSHSVDSGTGTSTSSSSSETRDISTSNSNGTPISAKKSKTTSWVWDHFTKISENKCKCNNCQVIHVVSGTGTMSRHMHSKHPTKIPKPSQSTLDFNGKAVKPYKFDPEDAHRAFIEFVITNKKETVEALLCLHSWYRAGLLVDVNVDAFIREIKNASVDDIDDEELSYAHMQCNSLFVI